MKAWLPIFAVLFLLPIAAGGSAKPAKPSAPDLKLTSIEGITLDPPVYFPAGSHVDNIFTRMANDQSAKGPQIIFYEASSPLSQQATYQYYRAKYNAKDKKYHVGWLGLIKGGTGSGYLFHVWEAPGVSMSFAVDQDARGSRADFDLVSDKYKHSPTITVGIIVPASRVQDFQQKHYFVIFPMPQ